MAFDAVAKAASFFYEIILVMKSLQVHCVNA